MDEWCLKRADVDADEKTAAAVPLLQRGPCRQM